MHRICVPPSLLDVPHMAFPQHVAHYLHHVLRLRVGDELAAFDGTGRECQIRLTCVSPAAVLGERLTALPMPTQAPKPLILGQAMPKGTKIELIIEKCSELGLTTLVPLYTTRTIVRDTPERLAGKMARWQRLAMAAARQCGRRILLDIAVPMSVAEFCAAYDRAPTKLVCWEEERQQGLQAVLAQQGGRSPVVALVGPEGGFTREEVDLARQAGFRSVTLGPRILRTETAAIVLTSIVRYSLGELEPESEGG
ncbi:MAG: 16S rRNA (uracil(1498)-N(3))-methyltransferase [Candidatus Tectimicrobiota bacterium]